MLLKPSWHKWITSMLLEVIWCLSEGGVDIRGRLHVFFINTVSNPHLKLSLGQVLAVLENCE